MPQPTSKARLVLTALFVDQQTPAEVAARYGVHRTWVYKLKARCGAEGETAMEPRSRRPKTSPGALGADVVDLIVRLVSEHVQEIVAEELDRRLGPPNGHREPEGSGPD